AEGRLGSILLNLCTRFRSDLWIAEPRWTAGKPGPLPIEPAEELRIGAATVRLLSPYPGIPRLWFALADRPFDSMIAERGGPIHYGYTEAWPMDVYQTLFSRVPGSAEMPSAARPITPRIREALEKAGIRVAPTLLHTGVPSREIRGLLTGSHDRVTGHLARLAACLGMDGGREAYAEAIRAGYLWHEFGDSHLVIP